MIQKCRAITINGYFEGGSEHGFENGGVRWTSDSGQQWVGSECPNCLHKYNPVITKLLNLRASEEHLIMTRKLTLLFSIISFSILSLQSFAQTNSFDQRLLAKFSDVEVKAMDADELAFWNYYVAEGFQVFEITKDASESEMEYLDFSGDVHDINPLELGLLPEETAVHTYRLGNTGHGLMIFSKSKIRSRMSRK